MENKEILEWPLGEVLALVVKMIEDADDVGADLIIRNISIKGDDWEFRVCAKNLSQKIEPKWKRVYKKMIGKGE